MMKRIALTILVFFAPTIILFCGGAAIFGVFYALTQLLSWTIGIAWQEAAVLTFPIGITSIIGLTIAVRFWRHWDR